MLSSLPRPSSHLASIPSSVSSSSPCGLSLSRRRSYQGHVGGLSSLLLVRCRRGAVAASIFDCGGNAAVATWRTVKSDTGVTTVLFTVFHTAVIRLQSVARSKRCGAGEHSQFCTVDEWPCCGSPGCHATEVTVGDMKSVLHGRSKRSHQGGLPA